LITNFFKAEFPSLPQKWAYTGLTILGDFNLPEIQWTNESSFCTRVSPFLSGISNNSHSKKTSQPTRFREDQASRSLDLVILCNPDLLIRNVIFTAVGNSNHIVIISWLCLPTKPPFLSKENV